MTKSKDEQRLPRPHILFDNYDYTSEGPNETSPGGGLYHGEMSKYKSVKEFIEKRRKQNKKLKKSAQRMRIFEMMLL